MVNPQIQILEFSNNICNITHIVPSQIIVLQNKGKEKSEMNHTVNSTDGRTWKEHIPQNLIRLHFQHITN